MLSRLRDQSIGLMVWSTLEAVREIAAAHGSNASQISLAWLLAKPLVSAVLLGARRMSQLEDNLGAAQIILSPEEIARLDAV